MAESQAFTHGLLIDLDGVIRRWPAERNAAVERDFGLPPGALLAAVFAKPDATTANTGRCTFEEWRNRIAARLAQSWPAADAMGAAAAWSAFIGEVDPAVAALVRRCRARARVVLVTNGTTRLAGDLAALGIGDLFDGVVNSAELGAAKPDPRVFQAAVALLDTPEARVLFVDDTEANVTAARAFGLDGHLFRDAAGLEAELGQRGVLPDD